MRLVCAGTLVVTVLLGCSRAGEEEHVGRAADTVITPRRTQDTTIVKSDTTVKVDTTVKKGQGTVPTDTVKR